MSKGSSKRLAKFFAIFSAALGRGKNELIFNRKDATLRNLESGIAVRMGHFRLAASFPQNKRELCQVI